MLPHRYACKLLAAAAAAACLLHGPPLPAAAQPAPSAKLIVIIVVDQMRADYLVRYGAPLTGGLRRMMRDGAWFTESAYPYLNTVTCAGHSTIGTGTFPYRHGMILNSWFDRETGTTPYCTDDETAKEISYNGLTHVNGDSAKRLLAPAIGEQIMSRGGRSAVMSLKPRSAVPLTGNRADAIVWFDDRGGWTSSTAFSEGPVPFLKAFIDANPIAADYSKVWERTLPESVYQNADDAEGEGTPAEWTRAFPHPLGRDGGKPDANFYARWQRSPYADEYLGRMAAAAVDALKLGQGTTTDFLGVSFSTMDVVGHVYGPRSHEVQDVLVRLDRTIGRLLDHLDARVGKGNYVVGLSADHGVADIPEQSQLGGRQTSKDVLAALSQVLTPALGPDKHVLANTFTDVYFSPGAKKRIFEDAKLLQAVTDTLAALPAVERVFRGDELATAAARESTDRVRRAAALSYREGRSGDLIIVPKQHWLLSSSVTTHGTLYPYDQRVPVLLFGAGVRPGRYSSDATPADVMPSLAALAGVPIQPTDGRVLKEAMDLARRSNDAAR